MAIVISGSGIDMGGNPVSNASQVDSTVINENGSNVISQDELAYDVGTSSYISNTLASGAIIERGSNANGEYIKYADGTLICRVTNFSVGANNTAAGSVYASTLTTWTFPHSFISSPSASAVAGSGRWVRSNNTTNTNIQLSAVYYSTSDSTVTVNAAAIGRWK